MLTPQSLRIPALLLAWAAFGFAAGCGSDKEPYHEVKKGAKVADTPHDHEHGPHSGHLVELGEEEYHAEVVFDPKAAKVTIYLLDSSAKKPTPIDAKEINVDLQIAGKPKTFTAKAASDQGDPSGKASRFELTDPDIKANIKDEEDLKGSVTAPIGAKTYTGKIVHEH